MERMFIDGAWRESVSGRARSIINPFNGEAICDASEGTAADAGRAVAAARRAFDDGEWRFLPAESRARFVGRIGDLIRRDLDELARLETLDTGKTLVESRADMEDIESVFRYFAAQAGRLAPERVDSPRPESSSTVVREPVGVCVLIMPWNYPLLQASWKVAPALLAGNAIILKPSELTPLTTIRLTRLMEEVGLPAGIGQLVLGSGNEVGAELAGHRDVDMVSFTGGVATGRKIMQAASRNIKRIALELGGKNPNIVFADADFDAAVDQALNAAFIHSGQVCSAGARLLVEDPLHDRLVAELVDRVARIKLGNGMRADTQCGPLISEDHRLKVERYVRIGLEEGAHLAAGGRRPDEPELQNGWFYRPTVFTNCTSTMRIVQEEVFGPVLTVERFRSERDAIRRANDTVYGLAGAVWSQDAAKADRVASELRMGTVWINDYHPYFAQAPWGGYKQSGIGRELAGAGLDEYTELKHIYRNLNPQPLEWFSRAQ